jgi:hypothetical protein
MDPKTLTFSLKYGNNCKLKKMAQLTMLTKAFMLRETNCVGIASINSKRILNPVYIIVMELFREAVLKDNRGQSGFRHSDVFLNRVGRVAGYGGHVTDLYTNGET